MYNRGTKYLTSGNAQKALQFFKKQISLKEFKECYLNMGNAYRLLGNYKMAEECYIKACDHRMPFVDGRFGPYDLALSNLGLLKYTEGNDKAAIALYEEAIRLNPKHYDALWNYASATLRSELCSGGEAGLGWNLYEYRFLRSNAVVVDRTLPMWDGINRVDTIVVLAEQGLGDKLMWGRYIPRLKEYCDRVVVQCPKILNPIFSDYETCEVVPSEGYGIPLCSLSKVLGMMDGDWLRGKFDTHDFGPGLHVGIEWSGSKTHANDANRSTMVSYFQKLSGVNLYNLNPAGRVVKGIEKLDVKDWADTARYVNGLDLLISIDTSIVHLAGSLGKECWMLQPLRETDFRWGTDSMGEKNVWYPSVKVIRNPCSWDKTFEVVYNKFEAWKNAQNS